MCGRSKSGCWLWQEIPETLKLSCRAWDQGRWGEGAEGDQGVRVPVQRVPQVVEVWLALGGRWVVAGS
eukprot:12881093-Prorocentrum_lima.AAC.1